MSFWLIKCPDKVLTFATKQRSFISNFFNHLYLTSCITDLLIRFCSVKDIGTLPPNDFKSLRQEILQHCINSLEHYSDDDFLTEQIFEILTGVVKKCYQMYDPKDFFDMLMNPFIFHPLLEFSFSGGANTKQGAEFLRVFFYNLFVASPHDALLDVMEANFGF